MTDNLSLACGSPEKDCLVCLSYLSFPCLEFLSMLLDHCSYRRSLCCNVAPYQTEGSEKKLFSWVWWENQCPCWLISLCCLLTWTTILLHVALGWLSSSLRYQLLLPRWSPVCCCNHAEACILPQQWGHHCHSGAYQQLKYHQWRPSSLISATSCLFAHFALPYRLIYHQQGIRVVVIYCPTVTNHDLMFPAKVNEPIPTSCRLLICLTGQYKTTCIIG